MRLFVALELPGEVRAALAGWAREAAGGDGALRLVGEDALHVTLAFLGERGDEDAGAVGALVPGLGPPPRGLSLGDVLWLAPRRPHVLTVAVRDPHGELGELHGRVWDGLGALGLAPERRGFTPHVTVARVRRGSSPARRELPAPPAIAFDGAAVSLMRSHLGRGPARYEVLARAGA